jgi:hypothetical protein
MISANRRLQRWMMRSRTNHDAGFGVLENELLLTQQARAGLTRADLLR